MNWASDRLVLDAGSIVVEIRQHLEFSLRGASDATSYYLIEDTLNSRFFRLGLSEYLFMSLLDGHRSIHEAYGQLSTLKPNHSLTEIEAISLCHWLVDMDLAQTGQSANADQLATRSNKTQQGKRWANVNPLCFRFPVSIPYQLFPTLSRMMSWLISWPALLGLALLTLVASYQVTMEWPRFANSTHAIFTSTNWIWLACCGLLLKLVHELAHGVTCHHFGGRVKRAGIMFLLFAPVPYVDVTSSWRFPSAGKRIAVAAAGMVAEWWIAAIAAIVWSLLEPGWLAQLCHNIVCMASFTSLVFNANPLMKFDGYYILSDVCGLTNLYSQGQRLVNATLKYWLLGVRSSIPQYSTQTLLFVTSYGWLSWMWRMSVATSLTLAATTFFGEASMLMATLAVGTWVIAPATIWLRTVFKDRSIQRRTRWHATLKVGIVVVFILGTLLFVPWPGARRSPAIVEYSPLTLVRASSDGFVQAICVERDQQVQQGDLLFVLENRELMAELKSLELDILQAEIQERRHEQKGELAAKQAAAQTRAALQVQRTEKARQVAELHIRAPESGRFLHRSLPDLLGKYVKQGGQLACIGEETHKELRVSIAQDDYHAFSSRIGLPVTLDVPGQWLQQCTLEKISPRAASTSVPPALMTLNGGLIPVKPIKDGEGNFKQEPLEPRLEAIARLDSIQSNQLSCGQRVSIVHRPLSDSMGSHLYSQLRKTLQNATVD